MFITIKRSSFFAQGSNTLFLKKFLNQKTNVLLSNSQQSPSLSCVCSKSQCFGIGGIWYDAIEMSTRCKLFAYNDVVLAFSQPLLNNGPDTIEELLDRLTVKKDKLLDDDKDELQTQQRLINTWRQALNIYREKLDFLYGLILGAFFGKTSSERTPTRSSMRPN